MQDVALIVGGGPGRDNDHETIADLAELRLVDVRAKGAWPALLAATGPVKPIGYYGQIGFGGIKGVAGEAKRASQAEDTVLAKRLWDVSITMTGIAPGLPAV